MSTNNFDAWLRQQTAGTPWEQDAAALLDRSDRLDHDTGAEVVQAMHAALADGRLDDADYERLSEAVWSVTDDERPGEAILAHLRPGETVRAGQNLPDGWFVLTGADGREVQTQTVRMGQRILDELAAEGSV